MAAVSPSSFLVQRIEDDGIPYLCSRYGRRANLELEEKVTKAYALAGVDAWVAKWDVVDSRLVFRVVAGKEARYTTCLGIDQEVLAFSRLSNDLGFKIYTISKDLSKKENLVCCHLISWESNSEYLARVSNEQEDIAATE